MTKKTVIVTAIQLANALGWGCIWGASARTACNAFDNPVIKGIYTVGALAAGTIGSYITNDWIAWKADDLFPEEN